MGGDKKSDPIHDPIQKAVTACCSDLKDKFSSARLIITHFLCGSITKAGAIRKSSVHMKQIKSNDSRSHDDVLRDHIRQLDRKNTILSIVEDWAGRQTGDISLSIKKHNETSISFAQDNDQTAAFSLSLPEDIITALCPENPGKNYMQELYKKNPKIKKHLRISNIFN